MQSPVCVPGLNPGTPCENSPDITFESGAEPEWVRAARLFPARIVSRRLAETETEDPAFVLLDYGNGACFEMAYSDGTKFAVDGETRRIWGAVQSPLTVEDLATYLLGPVLGFVLRKRRVTSLHASAVEINGRAVAFSGDAGFGKSTTAAALALRGIPVLAEDIVPLKENNGKFLAVPGYPRVCLWPDSVAKLLGTEDALPKLTPAWEKRYLALDGERGKFSEVERPLGLIYLFGARRAEENAPRVEAIGRRQALLELVQNTYMNWLPGSAERAAEFETLCRVVEQVEVRRIVPHDDPREIEALCQLILCDAGELLAAK